MQKISERVFIRGARLSYPALDKPVASNFDAQAEPKYQATFLMEPKGEAVQALWAAIRRVADSVYGDKAQQVLQNPDKHPLKRGDSKENVPDGYHGMIFLKAASSWAPDLRDANPEIRITGDQIREKFVPGYYVNAYVDIYPYTVKTPAGQILKSGITASLVGVQFCRYAEPFVGSAKPTAADYPDCTAEAEASAGDAYAASVSPAPAPVQQQMTPTQALDMAVAANERAMRAAQQQQTQQGYQTQAPAQSYQQQPDPRNFAVPGQQQGFQDDPMPF